MSKSLRALFSSVFAGLLATLGFGLLASPAAAAPLQCGDVVTESVKLQADLTDCPDDGLVVGADRITIDLNGREILSPCEVFVNCEGTVGIDNSGGYDRVRIRNGTVGGFEQNILLVGANRNTIALMRGHGAGKFAHVDSHSLALENSHRNVIKDSRIGGGDPGILLIDSDRNRFARSSLGGGITIRSGNGLEIRDGSDANTVVDSEIDASFRALTVADSDRTRVIRSDVGAYSGAVNLENADRSVLVGNSLNGQQGGGQGGGGLRVEGDRTTIRDNDVISGLFIEGDRNLIAGNRATGDIFSTNAIRISAGDRNVVRRNEGTGSFAGKPVILIAAAASRTSLLYNLATGAPPWDAEVGPPDPTGADGIRVEAADTLVRGNTAYDNAALGINAVDGVIDGGDNHASGNGDPRQCVGVVCTP